MLKVLFPENSWTLGALQGVNIVSNKVSPSREVKVTVKNETASSVSGPVFFIRTHPYVFDLLDTSTGAPSFLNQSGALLPFQNALSIIDRKEHWTWVKLQEANGDPIVLEPEETYDIVLKANVVGAPTTLVSGTDMNFSPIHNRSLTPGDYTAYAPTSFDFIRYYDYWSTPIQSTTQKSTILFFGDFKDLTGLFILATYSCKDYGIRTVLCENRKLRLSQTNWANNGGLITEWTLPAPGNYIGVFQQGAATSGVGTTVTLKMYTIDGTEVFNQTRTATGASSGTYGPELGLDPNAFVEGTDYYAFPGLLGLDTANTIRPVLWSFSSPEEMYWLSPIIKMPLKGRLSGDWLETLGSGRIDIDNTDPQEYEVRYSDTPPEGEYTGTDVTLAAPYTETLPYWAPDTSWPSATEWLPVERGGNAGPGRYYQVRIKFHQDIGGD